MLRSFLHPYLWHHTGVRSFFLLLQTWLFLAGLFSAQGSDSNLALFRVLNSDPSESNRIEALRQLEKNGPLEPAQIQRSIADTSPVIRAAMVRLGTPLCAGDPELALRLLALSYDRTPQVQRQMLLSLPSLSHPEAKTVYRKLLGNCRRSTNAELRAFAQSLPD